MAVYKQTKQSCTVYVVALGGTDEKNTKTADEKQQDEQEKDTEIKRKRTKQAKISLIKNSSNLITRTMPNFMIGNMSNYSGDANFQAQAQRNLEIVQDISSGVISTVVAGYLDPTLALITGTMQIISNSLKREQRNINKGVADWKATQSVNYSKARAELDLTDGRTRLR